MLNPKPRPRTWGFKFLLLSQLPITTGLILADIRRQSAIPWISIAKPLCFSIMPSNPNPGIYVTNSVSVFCHLKPETFNLDPCRMLATNAFLKINAGKVTDPLAANNPVFPNPAILSRMNPGCHPENRARAAPNAPPTQRQPGHSPPARVPSRPKRVIAIGNPLPCRRPIASPRCHPSGMPACSRWLSGATPPEPKAPESRTPAGVPAIRPGSSFVPWLSSPDISRITQHSPDKTSKPPEITHLSP